MTLRLGGSGRTSLAALASLTLATALACGVAMTGCGGDNNPTPTPTVDSGQDSSPAEGGMMMMADGGGKDSTTAQLAPPTFMPASGAMNPAPVTIAEAWPMGVTGQIYYTTDGTVPIAGGGGTTHLYTAPVPVTQPGTDTIIAIAAAPGYSTSNAASASYTVTVDAGPALMPCGAPTFTPNGGSITLAFGEGALIDGDGPDLFIWEIGPSGEAMEVETSADEQDRLLHERRCYVLYH